MRTVVSGWTGPSGNETVVCNDGSVFERVWVGIDPATCEWVGSRWKEIEPVPGTNAAEATRTLGEQRLPDGGETR